MNLEEKMNLRPKPTPGSTPVALLLTGPKSVLAQQIPTSAYRYQTWDEVLIQEGIVVQPGMFVHSITYSPRSPQNGQGWRAELTDQVGDFMRKFTNKRIRYTVRISCKIGSASRGVSLSRTSSIYAARANSDPNLGSSTPCANISPPPTTRPSSTPVASTSANTNYYVVNSGNNTPDVLQRLQLKRDHPTPQEIHLGLNLAGSGRHSGTGVKKLCRKSVTTMLPVHHSQRPGASCERVAKSFQIHNVRTVTAAGENSDEELFGAPSFPGDPSERDGCNGEQDPEEYSDNLDALGNDPNNRYMMNDPGASIRTTVSEEEFKLRNAGIEVDDMTDLVEERMQRFDQRFKWKVMKELGQLQEKQDRWLEYFSYAPLATKFLEIVFNGLPISRNMDVGPVVEERMRNFNNRYKLKVRHELRQLEQQRLDKEDWFSYYGYAPMATKLLEELFIK